MALTKEKLEARLVTLTQEFERGKANLEALHGAILDTQFWLAEFDKEEPAVAAPVATGSSHDE
jgi:hypothetical protein